jgi:hypothetical protein
VSTGKENFQQYDSRYNVTNKIAQPITVTVVKDQDSLIGENDIIEIPTQGKRFVNYRPLEEYLPENQNEAKTHRIQIRLSGDLTEGNCIEVDLDQLTEKDYTLGEMLVSVSVKNNLLKRNVVIASRVNFCNETDFPITLTIRDPNSDICDEVILKKSELVPISCWNLDAQIHLEYYDHTKTPEKHYKYPVKKLRDFCGSSKRNFP